MSVKILRALGLYAVLTVVLTYPLAFRLRTMDAGDSAFFTWVMGWEMHALLTDPASLPHANIYHPARYALGMDEPILGTMILALPLRLFTDDAVLLLNVARLLTFVLSGFTAYLLARELGCGEGPALFAGAAFAFSPIRTDQIAHVSTLGTQWLPLLLLYLMRFFRTGSWRDALAAALFYVLSSLACGYHGLIALLLLPLAALPLLWGRWDRLRKAAAAAVLAGVGLLPLYLLHDAAMARHGFARNAEETVLYSASLESFLSSASRLYGEATAPLRTRSNNLFPGFIVTGLVLAGAVSLWRRRQPPSREVLALAVLVVGAALLALGPEVRWRGRTLMPAPFALVRDAIPLFERIRVTSRAGVFIALPLAVLAARFLDRWRGRALVIVGVGALALAEGTTAPIDLPAWARVVDTRTPPPPVYRWLAEQPGEFAIVELPISENNVFERPAFDESIYMVHSTVHWKRLVNGYAGVMPAHYREARALARRFPSGESLAIFRGLGVRYVILHRGGYGPNRWARIERDLPLFAASLRIVAVFGGDTVFELLPAPGVEAARGPVTSQRGGAAGTK